VLIVREIVVGGIELLLVGFYDMGLSLFVEYSWVFDVELMYFRLVEWLFGSGM